MLLQSSKFKPLTPSHSSEQSHLPAASLTGGVIACQNLHLSKTRVNAHSIKIKELHLEAMKHERARLQECMSNERKRQKGS